MKYVLILCLLLSQTLGLVHSIEHAQHHSKQETVQAQLKADADQSDLFAGHDEEITCQLYDQLSLGGALVGDVVTQAHSVPQCRQNHCCAPAVNSVAVLHRRHWHQKQKQKRFLA